MLGSHGRIMDTSRNARWALAALAAPALLTACSEVPEDVSASTTAPVAAAAASSTSSPASPAGARTSLATADGASVGTVTFTTVPGGTEVDVKLTANEAVKAGSFHGIHVHANNDPANGEGCRADPAMASATWFTAVDGHLKEGTATHTDHTGDFPSLLVGKDGTASLRFTTDRFDVAEVVGKAVIVHASADNFGNIPIGTLPDQYTANGPAAVTKTEGTGNAGDRMACGMITRG